MANVAYLPAGFPMSTSESSCELTRSVARARLRSQLCDGEQARFLYSREWATVGIARATLREGGRGSSTAEI